MHTIGFLRKSTGANWMGENGFSPKPTGSLRVLFLHKSHTFSENPPGVYGRMQSRSPVLQFPLSNVYTYTLYIYIHIYTCVHIYIYREREIDRERERERYIHRYMHICHMHMYMYIYIYIYSTQIALVPPAAVPPSPRSVSAGQAYITAEPHTKILQTKILWVRIPRTLH